MQFREEEYEVMEEEGVVRAMVQRSGDVNQQSEVRCYTRQATAKVAQDYEERPDTNASLIFFSPGQWGLCARVGVGRRGGHKLQALVYDILPLEEGAGKPFSECGVGSVLGALSKLSGW